MDNPVFIVHNPSKDVCKKVVSRFVKENKERWNVYSYGRRSIKKLSNFTFTNETVFELYYTTIGGMSSVYGVRRVYASV